MENPISNQDEATSTGNNVKPGSPVPSMNRDRSVDRPLSFQREDQSNLRVKSGSPVPSCVSLCDDRSMLQPNKFQSEDPSDHSVKPGLLIESWVSMKSYGSVEEPVSCQSKGPPDLRVKSLLEDASYLKFKTSLKERFQRLSDGIQHQGPSTLLNKIFTELYITEGDSGEVNNEHEVRQMEIASRTQLTEDKPIKCNDIFNLLPGQDKPIRTVLTKGVAGIGKTVSVQKFILDWAEDKTNQDVHFIFPLPFRELNLLSNQHFSLESLIHHFFVPLKDIKFADISNYKTVFIFDGLDEHRSPLDFKNEVTLSDFTEKTSVDMLLTSLLKGCLLPSALIWITSRPAAASQIPSEHINQVTEIRGFNDLQKEEYFTKKISDQILAKSVISHLKASRSLYIMCHIPVFCWISATVLERMLTEAQGGTIPKTLTQMYTHFFIIQICSRTEKCRKTKEMIFKLGQLAFQQLIKGNLIFYEDDLRECHIDERDAVMYSGVCTQIFKEEFELTHRKGKVFCFVHLSIQEHLAALYVYLSFCEGNRTVLNLWNPKKLATEFQCSSLFDLHKCAVDKALESESGQFDLFLRFFLGISQEKSNSVLYVLLPHMPVYSAESVEETIWYIKMKIRTNLSPEKYINLFHCLNELHDFSLQEEIQKFQSAGRLSKTKLSSSQWAALVFVLLTSDSELIVFDVRKYSLNNADECLQRMLPVVMASKTAEATNCKLSEKGFHALAKAISSKSSNLIELILSGNKLHGSGINILSEGFKSSHCKVEILELSECGIDAKDFRVLALSLNLDHLLLRELDISFNLLTDSGVESLSYVLKSSHCRLEKLKLLSCGLTHRSCDHLAAVLNNNSSLTDLDLSKNDLGDTGVEFLSSGLTSPHCKLRCLSLEHCGLTWFGCQLLFRALKTGHIGLRELCLNNNKIKNKGTEIISDFLKEPHCKLEKLRLSDCGIDAKDCSMLTSSLNLDHSLLGELDISFNYLSDSGVESLSNVLKSPHCKLEKLNLEHCDLTELGCQSLNKALKNSTVNLRELCLNRNRIGDAGAEYISDFLKEPCCHLEKLRLSYCNISVYGCIALASAIQKNPSHLMELELIGNNPRENGRQVLSKMQQSKDFRLEKLKFEE